MYNYEKLNDFLFAQGRKGLLVIYKEGEKSEAELSKLSKLKLLSFCSDEQPLTYYIGGLEFDGLIVEEGAYVLDYDLRYAITRLRTPKSTILLCMDDAHKDKISNILGAFYATCTVEGKNYVDDLSSKFKYIDLCNFF